MSEVLHTRKQLQEVEAIANHNLDFLNDMQNTSWGTLQLFGFNDRNTKRDWTYGLDSDCDPINRYMLDTVYADVGIDITSPEVQLIEDPSQNRFERLARFVTDHGLTVQEEYVKQGQWEDFRVRVFAPESKSL